MKRTYVYEGFNVTMDLEPVWTASGNVTLLPPRGYIAVVLITKPGTKRPIVTPIRLTAGDQNPFATEAEALMAAFSAGQRLIDDTLAL
jgi:hypothetical protein